MIHSVCLDRAYTRCLQGKWWLFITTPSGDVARLLLSYATKEHAEQAMALLGYTAASFADKA